MKRVARPNATRHEGFARKRRRMRSNTRATRERDHAPERGRKTGRWASRRWAGRRGGTRRPRQRSPIAPPTAPAVARSSARSPAGTARTHTPQSPAPAFQATAQKKREVRPSTCCCERCRRPRSELGGSGGGGGNSQRNVEKGRSLHPNLVVCRGLVVVRHWRVARGGAVHARGSIPAARDGRPRYKSPSEKRGDFGKTRT